MRKLLAIILAGIMALAMAACGRSTDSAPAGSTTTKGTIGVAMPTKTSERWIKDGDNIKNALEAAGYKVNLQYANDDIPTQVTQVSDMVTKKNQVLVVAAIDGVALKGALKDAKDAGIPVIAYDRLLRETDAVAYYTTFDNYKVGVQQGESLVKGLEASGAPKPYNVEVFAGSPDDNNATFFYKGAMSVLQPKIDSGELKVRSGETDFNTVATLRWDAATAKKRMENLLTKSYTSADVNGVLSPYDGISRGVIAALKGAGYGSGGKKLPVVTGQDAELESVKSILAGEQYSTIFKDTGKLADATVTMIQQIASSQTVTTNDTSSYNNGVKVVPTMLLDPVSVDKSNIQQVLTDAKYYTADQLK
ncbi:multiple monosaccharide ABC transporter substrate-binding protein [Raineyella sp. LH-20]|uniref:multiple monosaccharide ABC transporter substrate-binding protein n=1 Tax=Raineyella sp. LH-20 TaxID=3081204 RepID=UPI002953C36D|nr:multiple monosaccharide ABC transporter substrate-binding protein [Raineyella sp. LH-20]WOP17724.1 multiple monosaccharide ABC transporter substrate-binding protein [Raineyella sp. LH-20]